MRNKRATARLHFTALAGLLAFVLPIFGMTPVVSAAPAATSANLALDKTMTASSSAPNLAPSNAADGNQASYWQSNGSTLPQWLQTDLGRTTAIGQVVLKLPSRLGDPQRDAGRAGQHRRRQLRHDRHGQGLQVQRADNTVTINFGATNARYVRVNVTGNTGQQAAQVAEFQVLAPAASPTNLALGKTATASSNTQNYVPGNATDGNQASLLGVEQQRVPAVAAGRPGLIGQHQPDRADPADGQLGRPHRDAVGAGQPGQHQLRHDRQLGGLQLRRHHQHRHHQPRPDHHPVPAAELHRQHRLARRAGLGVRGVRPGVGDTQPPTAPEQPRLHPAAVRSDHADLGRVDRQRRRHRLRHLPQQRAADQRAGHRADLHRQRAGLVDRDLLRPRARRGRQPVRQLQQRHPHRPGRRHAAADRADQPRGQHTDLRPGQADLGRVNRQRRRHRVCGVPQRKPRRDRQRQHADLLRGAARHRDRHGTTWSPRTRPATSLGAEQHGDPAGHRRPDHQPRARQAERPAPRTPTSTCRATSPTAT